MTEHEIYEKLVPLIQEVTGASRHQIKTDSYLMTDLGAESLDLLDLSFLIEEHFGITLEPDEFESRAKERLGSEPYEKDGLLTEAGANELRSALPEVDPEKITPGLRTANIPGVMNVAVFINLIGSKLQQKSECSRDLVLGEGVK